MNTTPLTTAELERLPERLPGWSCVAVDGVVRIERTFAVPDYATAMSFTQLLGEMADTANHHPTVLMRREHVTIAWWTMSTRSLTQIDLTMAQRTDRLFDALLDEKSPSLAEPQTGKESKPGRQRPVSR